MKKRITMKSVAEQAGVTQATVSMCLSHSPRISAATRARVKGIAKQLGYQPNPYLSTLMRARRQGREDAEKPVIAIINAFESPAGWRASSSATIREMYEGAMECAVSHGYRAEEFWLYASDMSAGRLSSILHTRGIHGLLLGPLAIGAEVPALKWEHFSVVRLGVPLPEFTVTTVCNDHFFSSIQLMRHCWELGYRRPGLIGLETHLKRFQGRWDGGLLVTEDLLPGTCPVKPLRLHSWDNLEPVVAWLHREKPDVIVSPSGNIIKSYLQRLGVKIPQKVGLATLSCPGLGDEISGIFQNGRLIGSIGIEAVIGMLERNECGLPTQARTLMVEGIWNPGRTLRKLAPVKA